jgi:uncharacterized protein YeaO (DUF488 family)
VIRLKRVYEDPAEEDGRRVVGEDYDCEVAPD